MTMFPTRTILRPVLRMAACTLLATPAALAQIRLPNVLSDHAVLQRGVPVRIWDGPLRVGSSPSPSTTRRSPLLPTGSASGPHG